MLCQGHECGSHLDPFACCSIRNEQQDTMGGNAEKWTAEIDNLSHMQYSSTSRQ